MATTCLDLEIDNAFGRLSLLVAMSFTNFRLTLSLSWTLSQMKTFFSIFVKRSNFIVKSPEKMNDEIDFR
jgi:hypothetical protein